MGGSGEDSLPGQSAQLQKGRPEQPQGKAQQPERREGPGSPRLEAVRGSPWILPPREKQGEPAILLIQAKKGHPEPLAIPLLRYAKQVSFPKRSHQLQLRRCLPQS